ncbi:MAG: hypothetical protein ACPL88_12820, partial [Bryobacteraceae bacterium]
MATRTESGADMATTIRQFLAGCKRPAVWEPGEPPIELERENYLLENRAGKLVLQAWNQERTLVRRIAAIGRCRSGRLELEIERFAGRPGRMVLVDLARGQRAAVEHQAARLVLRERLRLALARQYPNWRIAEISAETDLEHSLSPVYPRALLRQGRRAWAALMAPADPASADGSLSFGLVWLDYLRRREPDLAIEGLILFLPDGLERATCLRMHWLDSDAARFHIYAYAEGGEEEPVDPADYGNLDTELAPPAAVESQAQDHSASWLREVRKIPGVEAASLPDGALSLRVRGLEFARWDGVSVR